MNAPTPAFANTALASQSPMLPLPAEIVASNSQPLAPDQQPYLGMEVPNSEDEEGPAVEQEIEGTLDVENKLEVLDSEDEDSEDGGFQNHTPESAESQNLETPAANSDAICTEPETWTPQYTPPLHALHPSLSSVRDKYVAGGIAGGHKSPRPIHPAYLQKPSGRRPKGPFLSDSDSEDGASIHPVDPKCSDEGPVPETVDQSLSIHHGQESQTREDGAATPALSELIVKDSEKPEPRNRRARKPKKPISLPHPPKQTTPAVHRPAPPAPPIAVPISLWGNPAHPAPSKSKKARKRSKAKAKQADANQAPPPAQQPLPQFNPAPHIPVPSKEAPPPPSATSKKSKEKNKAAAKPSQAPPAPSRISAEPIISRTAHKKANKTRLPRRFVLQGKRGICCHWGQMADIVDPWPGLPGCVPSDPGRILVFQRECEGENGDGGRERGIRRRHLFWYDPAAQEV